ncbi:hypothetical protein [Micromonospora yangpuensis]|uniref:hypothetical protein n=1 Tax=Micromonospora yangpuensis TaxID=683228 RepID=UPI000B8176B8|nr:hypothetical protein [Micromonospora yangpuensis]
MSVDEAIDDEAIAVVGRRMVAAHETGHPCWRCTADTVVTCDEVTWWRAQLTVLTPRAAGAPRAAVATPAVGATRAAVAS